MLRLHIEVEGTVQGVGFRPCVYGLARDLGLSGFVRNTPSGVTIEVEGDEAASFPEHLRTTLPPLACVTAMRVRELPPAGFAAFVIEGSADGRSFTLVPPDVAPCADCLRELMDPDDRRFRHPFVNCTNCGPRYTITRRLPYDRAGTTMAPFPLCKACSAEYGDPGNRRFHAEPLACPGCGPTLEGRGEPFEGGADVLSRAADLLRAGRVLAVKGMGGFHLACDATDEGAVARLRDRKRRSNKPFALMARDMAEIARYARVGAREEALLVSRERPIVLLARLDRLPEGTPPLARAVAPGSALLGFMLPSTPLHELLFRTGTPLRGPLVMTSGNRAEEPIAAGNGEAIERLGDIAEGFVLHDREICMRVDDSVARVIGGEPRLVRRARGYTPAPIALASDGPDVLAVGADVKCAFTIARGRLAIPSQHLGDMESCETVRFFEETLRGLASLYGATPVEVAHDMHPGYYSTAWAKGCGLPRLAVQHHHAHVASVIAEHAIEGQVVGVAMDGSGYGPDGTLWGGEILVADALGYERAGHLAHLGLPGGEAAVREPWRLAVAVIDRACGPDAPGVIARLGIAERAGEGRVSQVLRLIEHGEFVTLASGLGRYFDAVAAVIGLCDRSTYEGEAAMALEAAAMRAAKDEPPYPFAISGGDGCPLVLDFSMALAHIIEDALSGRPRETIASSFHETVVDGVAEVALRAAARHGIAQAALSGGSFQNARLLEGLTGRLRARGLRVYSNATVPLNDGGISLGQALILRETLARKGTTGLPG